MNIGLLGYGKMGKSIEQIALERGHHIPLKTTSTTRDINFKKVDVAIDFSLPSVAATNIKKALDAQIPVISGTTGWLDQYNDVVAYCKAKNGTFLYASNFSLGVNLFFEINKQLAQLMAPFKDYSAEIEEIHHTEKLDAPSGTAISLADAIIDHSHYKQWQLEEKSTKNKGADTLNIVAQREANISGIHEITYASSIDSISLKHTAYSRKGFALGAVIAAEWIKDKQGVFTMKDVLNIK